MPGRQEHHRIQELHVRHEHDQDPGTMEQYEEKRAIHVLDGATEDRQGVRHADGAQCSGS
eukprot:9966849-Heterocapsa_arctica.AAC.1